MFVIFFGFGTALVVLFGSATLKRGPQDLKPNWKQQQFSSVTIGSSISKNDSEVQA
jgi:hypothetical protein